MKNTIIGLICFLVVAGTFLRFTDGSEGKEAVPQSEVVKPEKEYKLIEEIKVYLTTPKETFKYYCSPCHGKAANGKGIYFTIDLEPTPRDLTDVEYMAALTDDYLFNFISKGSAAMEKSELCPPWGNTFGEDRIKGIIAYLRGLTISKSKEGEEVVVKKKTVVTEVRKKGTPPVVIWSVLILLSAFLVYSAKREWNKLAEKEASKKK
ncbi:MAG: c-type cytochrome [Candidatus Scalindua sp.]